MSQTRICAAWKESYTEFYIFHLQEKYLRLDCGVNSGGGGQVSWNRNSSVWDIRRSGTSNDPDACKKPFTNPTVSSYVDSLYLLVHEGRHNQPGDQGHIVVNGSQLDPTWKTEVVTPGPPCIACGYINMVSMTPEDQNRGRTDCSGLVE